MQPINKKAPTIAEKILTRSVGIPHFGPLPARTPKVRPPREQTPADLDRLQMAEAKRARKSAKRVLHIHADHFGRLRSDSRLALAARCHRLGFFLQL